MGSSAKAEGTARPPWGWVDAVPDLRVNADYVWNSDLSTGTYMNAAIAIQKQPTASAMNISAVANLSWNLGTAGRVSASPTTTKTATRAPRGRLAK